MSSKEKSTHDSQISQFSEVVEAPGPILDNIAITERRRLCPNANYKYLICEDDKLVQRIPYPCHKRNCSICQANRQINLFRKYIATTLNWKVTKEMKINFLTITIKNVPEITKDWLEWYDKKLKLFIRRLQSRYRFEFGFINKEMTWSEDSGYHYHFHLLFYGLRLDLKNPEFNLSDIWRNLTKDSYFVKILSEFKNAGHSLNYLLKYVCKTTENNEAMQLYYDLTKKKRYFQTFGKCYAKTEKKIKVPLLCCVCFKEPSKNWSKFGIPVFDYKPDFVRDWKEIPYDYGKVKNYYNQQFPVNTKINISTQSLNERGVNQYSPPDHTPLSIYDRLHNLDSSIFLGYNDDLLREKFSNLELEKLKNDGYLFEKRPGEYERL